MPKDPAHPDATKAPGKPEDAHFAPHSTTAADQALAETQDRPSPQDPALAGTLAGQPPPLSRTMLPPIDVYWERYEVLNLLGKGGMGAVYRARDRRLGRIVALKFILGDDPQLAQRFVQEARAQARIEHDHVCKVHEVGEFHGHAFIAMQFINGHPLDSVQRQMSLEEKVTVLATIADAVHAAHRQGVIHRDLKPGNIMVERAEDENWRPMVMDFGLAHDTAASQAITQAGALLGTPQYMPPEQARGDVQSIDRRSDVYGLGAVLYELLTGQPPFVGKTVTDLLLQVLDREPFPPRRRVPSLPADLDTIALKCLQKDPTQRYESARALAEDLRRYLDGEPIHARQTSLGQRALRWAHKRPAVVGLASALMFGSILFGGIWVRTQQRARAEARELAAQAQLAAQLGQDVKEMELFMRVGYMMPQHDVTSEKEVVRERMRQIEKRAEWLPTERRAVAEYALGRGHLALREYGQALLRLQAAWDGGYHASEVSYALGRALGEQYKLKLDEVERVSDVGYRQRERQKLEAKYLIPARERLRQASAFSLESSEYLLGLLALYSKNNEEAVQKATAALRSRPWQYEAHVLVGDAWTSLGVAAQDRGRYAEGRRDLELAVASYTKAADIAHSDASIYESEARAWASIIESVMEEGGEPSKAYERGLLACDRAIEVEPQSLNAYERKIKVYERWGFYLYLHGASIRKVALSASEILAQASHLGEISPITYDAIANLEMVSSRYEIGHGSDPQKSLHWGRIYLQKSIARNPNFAWAWNDLGLLELTDYLRLTRHGSSLDKIEIQLNKVEANLRYSVKLDPSFIGAYLNLIDLHIEQAKLALYTGRSLDGLIKNAFSAVKICLEMND